MELVILFSTSRLDYVNVQFILESEEKVGKNILDFGANSPQIVP